MLADEYRQAANAVTGYQNAVRGHNQDRNGTLDHFLGIVDAIHQVFLHIDQRCHQFGSVDLTGAHGHKLMAMVREIVLNQFVGIVDDANGRDRINTKVRANQQRLGVGIADAAHGNVAFELMQVLFKLGAEGSIFNIMNLAGKALLPVIGYHTAAAGTQMGVIVHAKEHIECHVSMRDSTEKTTHISVSCIVEIKRRTACSGSWDRCIRRPCKRACCRKRFRRSG